MYLEDMKVDSDEDGQILEQEWAESPAEVNNIWHNNKPRYRLLIDKWTDIGEECKERKMTAAMMLRKIRAILPRN